MDTEETLKLFDSCWFELQIFKKHPHPSKSSNLDKQPNLQNKENPSIPEMDTEPVFINTPIIHTRSMSSDQLISSGFSLCPLSPVSVLHSQNPLQTIISGKEVIDSEESLHDPLKKIQAEYPKIKGVARRRRKKGISKSFSDLEFEELKGFMDLGFVFSEEDKESSLVEIIPGLQRLKGKVGGEVDNKNESMELKKINQKICRPYLSEAWEVYDGNPLMDLGVLGLSNENDVKDKLRWWAVTVASTFK